MGSKESLRAEVLDCSGVSSRSVRSISALVPASIPRRTGGVEIVLTWFSVPAASCEMHWRGYLGWYDVVRS